MPDRPTTAYRAALVALRRSHRPSHYVPSLIAEPSLNLACGQLIWLCLFLSMGTIASFFTSVARCVTDFDLYSVVDEAERMFPHGVELRFGNGTLDLIAAPDGVSNDDASSPGAPAEYICWTQHGQRSWCATAPLLEPIQLTLSPLVPTHLHRSPRRAPARQAWPSRVWRAVGRREWRAPRGRGEDGEDGAGVLKGCWT